MAYVFKWSPQEIGDLWWIDFVTSILFAEGLMKAEAQEGL